MPDVSMSGPQYRAVVTPAPDSDPAGSARQAQVHGLGRPLSPQAVDLLGALAYTTFSSFCRFAEDSRYAPTLGERESLADLAVASYEAYSRVRATLAASQADPVAAMAPFVAPVDAFHDRTEPQDRLERLVKAYVGDAVLHDFYEAVARRLEPGVASLVGELAASRLSSGDVLAAAVRTAVAEDHRVTGRLALWARRLAGEALSQANRVLLDRPELARAVAAADGRAPGAGAAADLSGSQALLAELTERHSRRLATLGLTG